MVAEAAFTAQSMRLTGPWLLCSLLLLPACGGLKDAMDLSASIETAYGVSAVVTVSNARHLSITLGSPSPDSLAAHESRRAAFARTVAAFAKTHYSGTARLEDITVSFDTTGHTVPIPILRTGAPYRFPIGTLP